jgi:hypothetical protein
MPRSNSCCRARPPDTDALHGLREADLLLKFHELEHVAADAAPEAVEEPLLAVHVERRCLLAVERAEPLPRRARLPERDMVLHHPYDVGLQPHVVDEGLGEEGHQGQSWS